MVRLFMNGNDVLDDGNVDGGESARAVDLVGGHCCGIAEGGGCRCMGERYQQ